MAITMTPIRTRPSVARTTGRRRNLLASIFALAVLLLSSRTFAAAFQPSLPVVPGSRSPTTASAHSRLRMAQASKQDAQKAIDAVVRALRSDSAAKKELGNLNKVENILGYGSPQAGKLAVRFNASFRKGGSGFLGFGMLGGGGSTNPKDSAKKGKSPEFQRGTMVGQVKASVDQSTGKVLECSVFRDLGYGRSFNLKTR